MSSVQELRQRLASENGGVDPYADMSDEELARALHERHYRDIPWEQFSQQAGLPGPPPEPSWSERIGRHLAKIEVLGPARDAVQENVVNPFARGVLRTRVLSNLATGDYGEAAALNRRMGAYAPSPESQAALGELAAAKGFGESVAAIGRNPELAVQLAAESLPLSGASLVGAAGGAAAGSLAGPVGAGVGGAVGTAAGSFTTEYLASLQEAAERRGVDLGNEDQLRAIFNDDAFMSEAREYAIKRGVPIAAFDALSFGIAGRLFGAVKRIPGMAGTAGTIAGGTAEVVGQAGAGMAGEAGAQLATEGGIKSWGDVTAEGIGELVPGAIETAIRTGSERFGRPAPGPAGPQGSQGPAGGAQGPGPTQGPPPWSFDSLRQRYRQPSPELPGYSGPQPPPTFKDEGQPPYPMDAQPWERPWFDWLWERDQGRDVPRPDGTPDPTVKPQRPRGFRDQPPPGPPPGPPPSGPGPTPPPAGPAAPAPTGAGVEPGRRVLPAFPPPAAAPAPVVPSAGVPRGTTGRAVTFATPGQDVEPRREQPAAGGWKRSASGGVEREIRAVEPKLPPVVSTEELVNSIDPKSLTWLDFPRDDSGTMSEREKQLRQQHTNLRARYELTAPLSKEREAVLRELRALESAELEASTDRQRQSPERVRKAIIRKALDQQAEDERALDQALTDWSIAAAAQELDFYRPTDFSVGAEPRDTGREWGEVLKRARQLLEGIKNDKSVIRARGALEQRRKELEHGEELVRLDVKLSEKAGHARPITRTTRKLNERTGEVIESRSKWTEHYDVVMNDGRSVGMLFYRKQMPGGEGYEFRPDKKLDKQLVAAIRSNFPSRWRDPLADGLTIANFVRDWEAGKRPRQTVEGEAKEIPGRAVDWRTTPEQQERMRQQLRGVTGRTPAENPPAEPQLPTKFKPSSDLKGLEEDNDPEVVEWMRKLADMIAAEPNGITAKQLEERSGIDEETAKPGEYEDFFAAVDLLTGGAHPDVEAGLRRGTQFVLYLRDRKPADVVAAADLPDSWDGGPARTKPYKVERTTYEDGLKRKFDAPTERGKRVQAEIRAERIDELRGKIEKLSKKAGKASEVQKLRKQLNEAEAADRAEREAPIVQRQFDLMVDGTKVLVHVDSEYMIGPHVEFFGLPDSISGTGYLSWFTHDRPPADEAALREFVMGHIEARRAEEATQQRSRQAGVRRAERAAAKKQAQETPEPSSGVSYPKGRGKRESFSIVRWRHAYGRALAAGDTQAASSLESEARSYLGHRKGQAEIDKAKAGPVEKAATGAAPVEFTSRTKHKALICASCSATKAGDAGKIPAEERYAPGAVVSAMAKLPPARRPDMLFLSAKYGLIAHSTPIEHYEQKLTKDAADRLVKNKTAAARFIATLELYRDGKVLVAAGGDYRRVFEAWVEQGTKQLAAANVEVEFAPAEVGLQRQAVKAFAIESQPYQAHRTFAEQALGAGERKPAELSSLARRSEYRSQAAALAGTLVEGGGITYIKDDQGRITGRTSSVNPDWAQALLAAENVSVKRVKEIAAKLERGEPLGVVGTRVANALIDVVRSERAELIARVGGWRNYRAQRISRRYDELMELLELNMMAGMDQQAKELEAKLKAMYRRYPRHLGVNEPGEIYRVERPVEKGAWREGRVLNRDHIALLPAEKKALAEFLKARPDRARILKMLEMHRGTPWAAQAIEGIFTRQAAIELIAGREPAFVSALDDPRQHKTRRYLKMGERGMRLLMEQNGLMSEASKPVNNVSSSFVNCSPSKDCARYCYATGGNYQHANVIVKSELVTLAVETDPKWAASIVERQYKATQAFTEKKALRLFDKGDMGDGWLPFIAALNGAGIRVQVFSRRPELLRKIPDTNVRLLSIDESNEKMADENLDLPVAYIYSGKDQIPFLDKVLQRDQLQVVLPIKQGRAILTSENVLELRRSVKGVAPYICPIDAGYKPLKTANRPTGWNCLSCDAKGGLGCFFGQPTRGIMAEAYPQQRDRAAVIEDLRRRLYAYIDENADPLAEAGQLPAGQPSGQYQQVDSFLARLMGGTLGEPEGQRSASDDDGAGDADGPDGGGGQGTGGVREEGPLYRRGGWHYSPLHNAIRTGKLDKGTGQQWLGYLRNQPGVKTEELDDTYLTELLIGHGDDLLTRRDVLSYVEEYGVQVADVLLVAKRSHPVSKAAEQSARAVLRKEGIRTHIEASVGYPDAVYFTNTENEPVTLADDDLDPDIRAAMEVVRSAGAHAAEFEEYTERGGKDYFELVLTVPDLPAEKRRQDIEAQEAGPRNEIRKKIFDKHAPEINRANAIVLALSTRQKSPDQVGLPPGWTIESDADTIYLKDPEGRNASFDSLKRLRETHSTTDWFYPTAWEHHRDKLERARDEEADAATYAAGYVPPGARPKEVLRGGHFESYASNAIVHVRAKERSAWVDEDEGPVRVLAIEEIQSDTMKAGRRRGFRKPGAISGKDAFEKARQRLMRLLADEDYLGFDSGPEAVSGLLRGSDVPEDIPGDWPMSAKLREAVIETRRMHRAYLFAKDPIADAPFKKSYNRLAMRRMLRWAAENGFEFLAWTPGELQALRYNVMNAVDAVRIHESEAKQGWVTLSYRAKNERSWTTAETFERDRLSEWVGGDLAKKLLDKLDASPAKGPWYAHPDLQTYLLRLEEVGVTPMPEYTNTWRTPDGILEADEFNRGNLPSMTIAARVLAADYVARIASEVGPSGEPAENFRTAMIEGPTYIGGAGGYGKLYDVELVSDTKKFIKQWGGKVEKIALDNGQDWHAVRITPELRAGLMQPIAVYEQQDLFGLQPGRDRQTPVVTPAKPAGPGRQVDMFGLAPEAQAAGTRRAELEAAKAQKESKLQGDKSVPADIGRPGDLFTAQQDLLDAASKLPTRPGTNDAQRDLRAAAMEQLLRAAGRGRRGVQVVASGLPADFAKDGTATLLGREVKSAEDLALVAQVYRDPRFETMRFVAVKNGKVIVETGVTSRLPAAVFFSVTSDKAAKDFFAAVKAAGADGYYLLHNHPSGKALPSEADITVTRKAVQTFPGFLAHVVIDHDEYGVIDGSGSAAVYGLPQDSRKPRTYGRDALVPHALLGTRVGSGRELAAAANTLRAPPFETVTLVGVNSRFETTAILNVPIDQLKGARGIALLGRLGRATGTRTWHGIVEYGSDRLKHLLDNGIMLDAIDMRGGRARSEYDLSLFGDKSVINERMETGSRGGRPFPKFPKPRVVGEPEGEGPGTLHVNPVSIVYRRYQRLAQRVIDRWNDKVGWRWDALGKLPRKEQYLSLRYVALGKLTKVREIAREVYDVFAKASTADQQAIYQYLTTAGASPAGIQNAELRAKAVAVKRLIDRIGRTLVLRGMLSSASYQKYKDAYLPRLYLKHILGEEGLARLGAGRRLSDQGYLRRRRNLPPDERVLLGEITDPAFLASYGISKTMRDLAIVDFLDALSGNADWVAPHALVLWRGRRVTPFWLKREADSLRQRAELYGPQNKAFAQNVANQMDAAANAALRQLANVSQDFEQLPDSARYGVLRGAWVRKEIHADLVGAMRAMPSDSHPIMQLFESGGLGTRVTQWWKQSKVALNPPAQVRNFLSNMVLVHLSGVALWRIPALYIRAINEIRTHGKYWRIARKYGLFESTFTNAELLRVEREWLDLQRRLGQGSPLAKMRAMAGILADSSSDVYQMSESIGKIAKLIDAMENDGLSESDAMIEAHKWLFDYSLVPKFVSWARNAPIGIPFLTFYYKATARLGEALVKHPVRFLPYLALGAMMAGALKEAWDIDDDEAEKLRQAMPNWIRERGHVWIMPWKDEHGRWQVFDFGYLLPWAVHVELLKALGTGEIKKATAALGVANGPIANILVAYNTGIDPFTNKPIYPEHATQKEQLLALLDYMWTLAAPPFVTSNGWLGKTIGSLGGRVNPRTGDPGATLWQSQLRLFGLNVYGVDPAESRRLNMILMQREIEDTTRQMGKVLRDKNLTAEDRADIRKAYQGKIRQLREDLIEYRKASAFPAKLSAPEPPNKEPEA